MAKSSNNGGKNPSSSKQPKIPTGNVGTRGGKGGNTKKQ